MTEAEWLNCTNPEQMLEFLRGKASNRKLRLFAVACCRRIWHLLDGWSQNLVEVSEQFVDGSVGNTAMSFASNLNDDVFQRAKPYTHPHLACVMAGNIAAGDAWAMAWNIISDARRAIRYSSPQADTYQEIRGQSAVLREIFGPLALRSVALNPTWLSWKDGTIPELAQAIYDDRRFENLPILANALEEAGCDNEELLAHLRSNGSHVRGCWAVDFLLGKE
jgi:hypothetical protein